MERSPALGFADGGQTLNKLPARALVSADNADAAAAALPLPCSNVILQETLLNKRRGVRWA